MGFPQTAPKVVLILLLGGIAICYIPLLRAENIKCGQRNVGGVDPESRSPKFNESDFGEFPWIIDIVDIASDELIPLAICSASLIHPRVVLTAAHCIKRHAKSNLRIRAGLWHREIKNERLPYQERRVEDIIAHPNWDNIRKVNNLALVIVSETFTMAAHINSICLPPANHITANGTACYASGWGSLPGNNKDSSQIMKRVTLSTVTIEKCIEDLQFDSGKLDNSVMCAVGCNGTDTCGADGGAPLVSRIGADTTGSIEQYHQIGISSFGGRCFDGLPSGYTNVANARELIDAEMTAKGFGTSSYTAATTGQ